MERIAVYPGSFDPITNGHLDVAERALKLFDKLVIAVAYNAGKNPFFSQEERKELILNSIDQIQGSDRVIVDSFDGLLVDYAQDKGACALVRGLRAVSDFEFEFQLALMNRKMKPAIETIFLMPKDNYSYLSSRIIKEIGRLEGEIHSFVPECVEAALKKKFNHEN